MTPEELALIGVDTATILAVWSWGFGSVVFFWFLGFVIKTAIDTVKKM